MLNWSNSQGASVSEGTATHGIYSKLTTTSAGLGGAK
jgi:hypothetical protein